MEPVHVVSVGPYELVRPIAEGGMAQVYLCLRRGAGGFEKRVVLKVLHSNFVGNTEYVEMFLDEARLLARMQHPNIVQVFEVECVGGVPYLAMEYVNGPTLGRLFRAANQTGLYDPGYLLHAVYQTCLGLHHAHTLKIDGVPAGLVHRDVSSQNVLVDAATGVAKLIDFGIAKVHESPERTKIGVLKGKLTYMAPEVLKGVRPDARADIYSLGVILYRIVTNRMPFPEGEELIAARIAGRYPKPSEVAENVSPQTEAIITRALDPDPDARWQTAAEFAAALLDEVARLRTDIDAMPRWIARVFPGGESDWSARHEASPLAPGGDHSSLSLLVSDGGSGPSAPIRDPAASRVPAPSRAVTPTAPSRASVTIRLGAVVGAAGALFVAAGICFGSTVWLGVATLSPSGRDADAETYLDAADDLLRSSQIGAARDMNTRAGSLGVQDAAIVVRITNQRGEIERKEALVQARASLDAGDLGRAREIIASALAAHPTDLDLAALLSEVEAREEAARAPATGPRPTARPATVDDANVADPTLGPPPDPDPEPAPPEPDPRAVEAEPRPTVPAPAAPAAATKLEDLDVEVGGGKVVVRGSIWGRPVEPVGYYLEEDTTHSAYVIRLKRTASALGVEQLAVSSPLVRGVSVTSRGQDVTVTVDCDAAKVSQPSFQSSPGGFVLTVLAR